MKTIQEIKDELSQTVIGQPELVRAVSLCFYRHMIKTFSDDDIVSQSANNLLIIGNTGTGKTFSVKQAAKLLHFPFIEINSKSISQEGWSGTSFISLLKDGLKNVTGKELDNIATPVIFVDEFDKLLLDSATDKHDNISIHLQSGLLKYIEGMQISLAGYTFNTSKFCFIFAGAFNGLFNKEKDSIGFDRKKDESQIILTDRLVKFGMLPELAGRITRYVTTKNITEELFRDLICDPNFVSNRWFSFLKAQGLDRKVEPNWSHIINEAVKRNLGVRGLVQLIDIEVDKVLEDHNYKPGFSL
jgi:ATP-dependent Clp protease ATP-binding subunit ClpX